MPFADRPTARSRAAVADAVQQPYWLARPDRPEPRPALRGKTTADLLVIGGGFTGLWAALEAVRRNPGRDVVLLEGGRLAEGATGRNGGFMAASLTHGFANGLARWPDELSQLTEMGQRNLAEIEAIANEYGIECALWRCGELDAATEDYQLAELAELPELAADYGEKFELLDAGQARRVVNSPTYVGGLLDREGVALVDPGRLAWGLAAAAERLGVRIYEHSPVESLEALDSSAAGRVLAATDGGRVSADRVVLATNAYPPLLKRMRAFVVPVYDHVLVSEPIGGEALAALGWESRSGVGDSGNQFHYYRLTEDNRLLWGGYDAVYFYGNGFGPSREHDDFLTARLAEHALATFPQLDGLRFEYTWAGAIDTCSRFSAFWGKAFSGALAYVAGYTGLGVGASRFGAQVCLDMVDGLTTERTELEMVRTKPVPFPPEPFRWIGISATRKALAAADRREGRRNLWLRSLDRLGLGFDS